MTAETPRISAIPLRQHILVVVVAPIVLLIAMGGMLAWQVERMSTASDWVAHTHSVIGKLFELRNRIAEQESGLRGYLMTGDRAQLAPFQQGATEVPIQALIDLTADNPVQTNRLTDLRAEVTSWRAKAQVAIDAPDWKLQRDDLPALVVRTQTLAQARKLIEAGVTQESDLLFEREKVSTDTDQLAKILFVVLIALAAIGVASISWRQIGTVSTAFAQLVSDERASRAMSARWEWIRRGQAQISSASIGERSTELTAAAALGAVVAHTQAAVGALYRVQGAQLVRIAGHALAPEGSPAVLAAHGGQLGQALADRQPRRVRGLEGTQLRIAAGVGSREPAEIVIAPAIVDDRAIGVLELGFTGAADERIEDLLASVMTTIATAIRGAEQRTRLQELLEETQRQGEELQAQHEELRVTNEELEAQGSALREAGRRQEAAQHELEAANANLEEQTAELEAQKDEMLAAQHRLEERARELAQASQYKSEFLAKMSHELRTPLNSSLILARLLGDNSSGNLTPEQVKFANTIHAAGNDLLVLINDILDLAKIEAGKLELRTGQVHLARIRDQMLREFEPLARSRGLGFTVDIGPGVPEGMITDEQRLVQVLRNLASNACKFTEKGAVTIAIGADGDRITYAVRDTGIGIPRDHLERVFEAFHQVDGSVSRRHGGTGLGLAISRELAALLGGTLDMTSTVGAGTTFTLSIPREIRTGAITVATPGHTPLQTTGILPTYGDGAPVPPAHRRSSNTPPPVGAMVEALGGDDRERLDRGRRTLLVIEDDPAFAGILRDLGREMGFQVLLAGTADEGIAMALRYVPDGVLLDMQLPDHSGLSVLERLKRQPATRHIPVHVCSVDDHVQRSMELGAIGYLMKPAKREELAAAIHRIEDRTNKHVRHLLIVEDDPTQAEALTALLGGAGVAIDAVPTIAGALAKLKVTQYDCVVMDLKLPDGTGMELLDKMAHLDGVAFPPVIVHTGKDLSDAEEAQLRGFSSSIIVKGAKSADRLVDEVTLFLHQVEADLPPERQRLLRQARDREALFEGRRVLIVEDDVRNVFALSSVLEPKGLDLKIARNGREALEMLAKHPIDMVLMDVMMPEMDGIEATKQIRQKPGFSRLPIIALTAKAMADDRAACLDAGANDYLAKPINVDMLLSLMRVWMPR